MLRKRVSLALTALSFFVANAASVAQADTSKGQTMTLTAQTASETIASVLPAGYQEVARRPVTVDGEHAELLRYERKDGRNATLGGEHFSTVISDSGRLKGFARMDLDLVGDELPSQDEALTIAMDFLRASAPDLLPGLKVSWVDTHDEPLRVTRDAHTETLTLTGIKVKMRNTADGLWMWVIVGADRKVMVFERDIHWITFPGHHGTEKWLHDSWGLDKGHALPRS
ncbi:hypothetical protein [uncultured Celeribacter sp.]|uniref:hypothetical protein n=1 Tax=uncultured Celeribacter sp. TaxID=1303376 RepID=UPI002AA7D6D1|nr:hypothetical protein [uncultured Celeribacter sp.]